MSIFTEIKEGYPLFDFDGEFIVMKSLVASSLFVALLATQTISSSAYAADYKIDPGHSQVGFKVRHLAISNVAGNFADFSGTFTYDPKNVSASKVQAKIAVKSVNTSEADRDKHLRGEDFFATDKFPEMTFVSKEVVPGKDGAFTLKGDLTLHGVTKSVTLDVEFSGAAKDPWGNERVAFAATTKLKRSEFGLTWNKVLETGGLVVGDDVTVMLEIEGTKVA